MLRAVLCATLVLGCTAPRTATTEPPPNRATERASAARAPDAPTLRIDVLEPGRKLDPVTGEAWRGKGRYVFDDSRAVRYTVGDFRTENLSMLAAKLTVLHAANPDATITIAPMPGTVDEDVTPALDAVLGAGFSSVLFVSSGS